MLTVRSFLRGAALTGMVVASAAQVVRADNNIVFGFDAYTVRAREYFSGADDFARFSYPDVANISDGSIGKFGSFVFTDNGNGRAVGIIANVPDFRSPQSPLSPDPNNEAPPIGVIEPVTNGSNGSPDLRPLIDRGIYGYSFNPADYTAELTYKPRPDLGNAATTLRLALEQNDGFNANGLRQGDQWAYVFVDLVNYYNNNPQLRDSDGFITIRNNAGPNRDADFDNDNDVDGADFLAWQRGFGLGVAPDTTVATNAQGDANFGGSVTGLDHTFWTRDYGTTPGYKPGALDDDSITAMPNATPAVPGFQDLDGNANDHAITQAFAFNGLAGAQGLEANDTANFGAFGGPVIPTPHGIVQALLQSTFDANNNPQDAWEIKRVVVKKIVQNPNVIAEITSRTGFTRRNGAMFQMDHGSSEDIPTNPVVIQGVNYYPTNTDQVNRFDQNGFTNLFLKTRNTVGNGVLELLFPSSAFDFNGTQMSIQIRGRLTQPQGAGQANHINVVVKDRDTQNGQDLPGADSTHGFGGEQYSYSVSLSGTPNAGQVGTFSTGAIANVSIPLTAFSRQAMMAQHFLNPGDGLLTNFNLMSLGLVIDGSATAGAGAVNMEIEWIRIIPTSMALAMAGDVVPEPAAAALVVTALLAAAVHRRRRA